MNMFSLLQWLQSLAASVYYSSVEIECHEAKGRPGRPKKGSHSELKLDAKIRHLEIRRLKDEVLRDSEKMTAMLNQFFRSDRPADCFCGNCENVPVSNKRKLEMTEQPGPSKKKVVDTMVWVNNFPEFMSLEQKQSINEQPLDLSTKSSPLNTLNLQPRVYVKDIKCLLKSPPLTNDPQPGSFKKDDDVSWYVKSEAFEDPILLKEPSLVQDPQPGPSSREDSDAAWYLNSEILDDPILPLLVCETSFL